MYETQVMTHPKCRKFMAIFDEKIGTEYEISPCSSGEIGRYYITCFDVTPKQVIFCEKREDLL